MITPATRADVAALASARLSRRHFMNIMLQLRHSRAYAWHDAHGVAFVGGLLHDRQLDADEAWFMLRQDPRAPTKSIIRAVLTVFEREAQDRPLIAYVDPQNAIHERFASFLGFKKHGIDRPVIMGREFEIMVWEAPWATYSEVNPSKTRV